MVKKMKEKVVIVIIITIIVIEAMVAISPIFEFGLYGDHTFANSASPFAPSI
jgi:hypothetical protein